jgi:hypothetical protein
MPRKPFGPNIKEVWRKLGNEELHNFYLSRNIIRMINWIRIRLTGHIARMDEMKYSWDIFSSKSEGKIPLGSPRCRWEDTIKIDLREVEYILGYLN